METNILVVDDEKEIADFVELYLKNDNYHVFKFYNGTDALDCIFRERIDLAILDIMMPGLNGWEATEKIRAMKRWDAERVSIIALSANSFADDIVSSKLAGMDMHLSKPLDEKKMLETIKQCLSKHMNDKKL